MFKKSLFLAMVCYLVIGSISLLQAQVGKTEVGGHLKLTLFDYFDYEQNGIPGSHSVGMNLSLFFLSIVHELSDKISVLVQPEWRSLSGASPKYPSEDYPAPGSTYFEIGKGDITQIAWAGFLRAQVNTVLPGGYEMSFGALKPLFTWEYSDELFWEEEYHGTNFAVNPRLGMLYAMGFEFYKSFELGPVSLPAYLYILNDITEAKGFRFADNNNEPSVMLTVVPEIGPFKLKGTFAYGRYDDGAKKSVTRYAAGLEYTYQDFTLRSEYAGGIWEKGMIMTGEDVEPSGYYIKLLYQIAPWVRATLNYSFAEHNYAGFFPAFPGREEYTFISPGLQLYLSPTSIILINYAIEDWSQREEFGIPGQKDDLKFNRFTVGWRTTF